MRIRAGCWLICDAMVPPHIVEREEAKALGLLSFALEQRGVRRSAWAVAMREEQIGPQDDCICLWRQDGRWLVHYTERGTWREMASFPEVFEAVRYFFAQFARGPSPYDVREQWEAATGQSFSMVE